MKKKETLPTRTKTKKPNIPKNAKKTPRYKASGDYLNYHSMRKQPISKDYLAKVAKDLVQWAVHDETALCMNTFYINSGMPQRTVWGWASKNKLLAEALDFAKMALGTRRELGALTRKLDATVVVKSMPMYSQEWKDLRKWEADLRTPEEDKGAHTFVINMPSFEEMKKGSND